MASCYSNGFVASILVVLLFSSVHPSLASRRLLQIGTTTPGTVPTLPVPTIPSLPNPTSLPTPTTLPNPSPLPIPTLPSGVTIPTLPSGITIPTLPSGITIPTLPQIGTIPAFIIPNLALPPLPSFLTSIPFLAPPPSK